MPAHPRRRILFVLRGKLGDTVTAFATVRSYVVAFPDDDVTLLVRASYAPLFRREQGIRVAGFSSRAAMFAKLVVMRWFEPPFDALLVESCLMVFWKAWGMAMSCVCWVLGVGLRFGA